MILATSVPSFHDPSCVCASSSMIVHFVLLLLIIAGEGLEEEDVLSGLGSGLDEDLPVFISWFAGDLSGLDAGFDVDVSDLVSGCDSNTLNMASIWFQGTRRSDLLEAKTTDLRVDG